MAVPALPPPSGVPNSGARLTLEEIAELFGGPTHDLIMDAVNPKSSVPSSDDCCCRFLEMILEESKVSNSYLSQIAREITEQGRKREEGMRGASAPAAKEEKDNSWTTFLLDGFSKLSQQAASTAVAAMHNRFSGIFSEMRSGGNRLGNFARGRNQAAKNAVRSSGGSAAEIEAASAGRLVGFIGAIGAAGVAVGAFATALVTITQAVNARARELAPLSPTLAMSSARADIKSFFADVKEAQTLGPGMARVQDASTDIWVEIRNLLLPIKEFLIDKLATLLEFIRDVLQGTRDGVIAMEIVITDGFQAILDLVSGERTKALEIIADIPDHIARKIKEGNAPPPDIFKEILDRAKTIRFPTPNADPVMGINVAQNLIPGLIL